MEPKHILIHAGLPVPCRKISSSALHMLLSQHLIPYCSVTGVWQFSRMCWEKQPRCWVMVPSSFLLLTKHTLPVQVGVLQCGTSQAHNSSSAQRGWGTLCHGDTPPPSLGHAAGFGDSDICPKVS